MLFLTDWYLTKNGNKMSKRLGNAVDPFKTIDKYGPDATRWYMITNSQPWDNLRFDEAGIDEIRRKFLGTLYNTYSFLPYMQILMALHIAKMKFLLTKEWN